MTAVEWARQHSRRHPVPRVLFCYHHEFDRDRVRPLQQVSVGVADVDAHWIPDREWEASKRRGRPAVHRLLDDSIRNSDCTVLVLGTEARHQLWLAPEIDRSVRANHAVVGVDIREGGRLGDLHFLLPPRTPILRWSESDGWQELGQVLREALGDARLSQVAS